MTLLKTSAAGKTASLVNILPCSLAGIPSVWHSPEPVMAAALDDPDSGLLVYDHRLRPVHVTSQVYQLLGIPLETRWDKLDILRFLSFGNLDETSRAAVGTRILKAGVDGVEPVLLRTLGSKPRDIRMKQRGIGSNYRLVTFSDVHRESEVSADSGSPGEGGDWLTGLASRQMYEDALAAALGKSPEESLAVIFLDLDRFKAVNDTLGHAAGDAVLRLAAGRMQSAVRKTDLVARLGGDEFAVLVQPSTTANELVEIAVRILEVVQRTYLVEGQLVNVGVSLGIALSPHHGNTPEILMRRADLALYDAKASGRATFRYFEAAMEARVQARRENELELRRALALRQLEVHYQPQVDIKTCRLVGFEALVRWRHPVRGLIPPNDFLPLAEDIGIIVRLGDWVLRTACRQAMSWDKDVVIAVNASPLQFLTGNFADTVRRVLSATGLAGERLEIEITEGILLRNEDKVLATLNSLREMNVKIAMDDFGTGYASLSQLAQFPFDKIKIDRSLAGVEGHNPKNRAIIRAIAAMGESLGVDVMAEGVENTEQLYRLQNDGCKSVQGFLFSKAVPASQLKHLIEALRESSLGHSDHKESYESTTLQNGVLQS